MVFALQGQGKSSLTRGGGEVGGGRKVSTDWYHQVCSKESKLDHQAGQ